MKLHNSKLIDQHITIGDDDHICKLFNDHIIVAIVFNHGFTSHDYHPVTQLKFKALGLPYNATKYALKHLSLINKPNIIIIKQFYWDIRNIAEYHFNKKPLNEINQTILFKYINYYEIKLNEYINYIQLLTNNNSNNTIIALLTSPPWNEQTFQLKDITTANFIGKELLKIIRKISFKRKNEIILFDFYKIFSNISDRKIYLRDPIHLKENYSLIELNVILQYIYYCFH